MVGNLDIAFDVFVAGRHVREDRSQKIITANALNLRRNFLAVLKPQQRQRTGRIPPPARAEDRRRQRGLLQNLVHGLRLQEVKNIAEREAVLLGQSNVQSVVGGGRLQFEIERPAETLA